MARAADLLGRDAADALPLHVGRAQVGAHEGVGQRAGLDRRVPALEVVARVGLGHAGRLGLAQGRVEAGALLHAREDARGGGVEQAPEAQDAGPGQAALGQVEDRPPVQHRPLVAELHAVLLCQALEGPAAVGHRALVGGHHVDAAPQGRAGVVEGRPAGARLERRDLEQHVGRHRAHELERRAHGRALVQRLQAAAGPHQRQGLLQRQAGLVDGDTVPRRGDAGDARLEAPRAQLAAVGAQQPLGELPAGGAEAGQGQAQGTELPGGSAHVFLRGQRYHAPAPVTS